MSNDSSDETVSSFLHLLECARVCADVAAPFICFFVFFPPSYLIVIALSE